MARRADPERIHQAKRAAIAGRLGDGGMPPELVERWLVSWEATDEDRHSGDYWERGLAWVNAQRSAGRRAP